MNELWRGTKKNSLRKCSITFSFLQVLTERFFFFFQLSAFYALSMVLEAEETVMNTINTIFAHMGLSLAGETYFNTSLHNKRVIPSCDKC